MTVHCPLDQAPMEVASAEGHAGYLCPRCAGLWLPATYLATIAHERNFDVDSFHAKLALGVEGKAAFPCPDGHVLSRVEYRTLELEWCATCRGVWFDAGELRRLLDLHPDVFKEGGGSVAATAVSAGLDLAVGIFFFSQ